MEVRFDWDIAKSDRNLAERGFDFAFASRVFSGVTAEWNDARRDYGEIRRVAVGRHQGAWVTVVYTDRTGVSGGIVRRIISARVSNRRERQAYLEAIAKS
ncbi:MAG: BrnT family toxin [Gemmatimonadaceae bacterium]|nr:BrnT family toxin [Gemmatimonadaceae bacterium]